IEGPVIDLFDPELPILAEKEIKPGEQAFLYDIGAVSDPEKPQVLAAASRVYQEKRTAGSYSFLTKSPEGTGNVMRILLPSKPRHVRYPVRTRRPSAGFHRNGMPGPIR